MARCPECDRVLAEDERVCRECVPQGFELAAADEAEVRRLVPIARFLSVAEAGFFANELMCGHDIPVTMTSDDNFNAMDGYWTSQYVLSVPAAVAETARQALQLLIASTDADEDALNADAAPCEAAGRPAFGRFDAAPDGGGSRAAWGQSDAPRDIVIEDSNVNWVPIVLTLAAGSIAFWTARKLHDPPRPAVMAVPARPQREVLWDFLTHEPAPWVQTLANGRGLRELRVDPQRQLLIIREDADGDGDFEHEFPFPREALQR